MKVFTYIISILALGLIVFNVTQVNFNSPFKGDSIIALITIVAGLCAIFLMTILRISKKIEKKVNQKS
ncbi:hypothetical protein [Neotamlana laminarinivorans]|uniref:Uncharacterized protein n=1 Tax=Neotamlana laminarinivorans TaxID=2883124 RepID=A0A9X1HZ76_9FLAO|nr:hypothetical protein [Tamlana laminarinivorans]MCB4798481.1 hypothetical protein [Tamlana laminarinivorans]